MRQNETIISWQEENPSLGTDGNPVDMALSFADAAGCKKVWDEITRAQDNFSLSEVDHGSFPRGGYLGAGYDDLDVNGDEVPFRHYGGDSPMESAILGDEGRHGLAQQFFSLPSLERGALEEISRLITENSGMGTARDKILSEINGGGKFSYVEGLLDAFRKCEDLEDVEGLQILYRIFRGLFLLADPDLLRFLLADERILDVIGVLEYDPDYYSTSVRNGEVLLNRHRDFLAKNVEFKEVIPIDNESVVSQIHQNYRISYLKDVILPRALDDGTFAALSHMIFKNNNDIVMHFLEDRQSLVALFEKLQPPVSSSSRTSDDDRSKQCRTDALKFLVELCSLAKSLVCSSRDRFHELLVEVGLFPVCERALEDEATDVQMLATELISAALLQNQGSVRTYVLSQEISESMLAELVKKLDVNTDTGVFLQVVEILRTLLDPESIASESEKSSFVDLFYENFVQQILSSLVPTPGGGGSNADEKTASAHSRNVPMLKSYICDFFSFCVTAHGFRAKYFILRNNVVAKVLSLLKSESAYVAVSALRFFRACVGAKDHFYNRYLVRNHLMAPIANAFAANGNRDNLLNSSILELLDFITKENIKELLAELIENHESAFYTIAQSTVFIDAKKIHQENMKAEAISNRASTGEATESSDRYRQGFSRRAPLHPAPDLDEDEAYFESDDGDDTTDTLLGPSPPSPPSAASSLPSSDGFDIVVDSNRRPPVKPLVDYPLDDDDEPASAESPGVAAAIAATTEANRKRPALRMTLESSNAKSSETDADGQAKERRGIDSPLEKRHEEGGPEEEVDFIAEDSSAPMTDDADEKPQRESGGEEEDAAGLDAAWQDPKRQKQDSGSGCVD